MSSGGALTDLAAKGAQDAYLTLRPSMTLFKGSYKRYTNFAVTQLEQCFQGNCNFGKKLCATIQRNGDLLAECYLVFFLGKLQVSNDPSNDSLAQEELDILVAERLGFEGDSPFNNDFPKCNLMAPGNEEADPVGVYWTNCIGHALIETVSVSIGGHEFDCHTGDFLQIWESLTAKANKELESLIGCFKDIDSLFDFSAEDQIIYVPLKFWFNRSWQQALPLIALQYHQVRIDVRLRPKEALYKMTDYTDAEKAKFDNLPAVALDKDSGEMMECFILANYVFLDTFERRLFAQKYHTYVFDQLQFTGPESKAATKKVHNIELRFNHPVQELIWVIQEQERMTVDPLNGNDWFDYSLRCPDPIGVGDPNTANATAGVPEVGRDPLASARLQLNGHDRFEERDAIYFRKVVPLEHHTRIPDRFIYSYSFAKDPEHATQPTGSVNMSRIDNVVLQLHTADDALTGTATGLTNNRLQKPEFTGEIRVYARSKNVMRVISGMAGIRYSN